MASFTGSMNADGKRGSGKRVDRTFPVVPKWGGVLEIYIKMEYTYCAPFNNGQLPDEFKHLLEGGNHEG